MIATTDVKYKLLNIMRHLVKFLDFESDFFTRKKNGFLAL